uniref:Protein-tyrosine-phosphatase n=1 Tax=Steinernema glaseri TaxID=37863 RepID=A0A1I7ZAW5_9BILA
MFVVRRRFVDKPTSGDLRRTDSLYWTDGQRLEAKSMAQSKVQFPVRALSDGQGLQELAKCPNGRNVAAVTAAPLHSDKRGTPFLLCALPALLAFFWCTPGTEAIAAVPSIQNLRARLDSTTDSIFVEWSFAGAKHNVQFVIRYRLLNRDDGNLDWKIARTSEEMVRLHLPEIRNGDELEVQVKAERGGHVIEDWSQQLLISVTKQMVVGGLRVPEDDLIPPLDFQAHILGPSSVRLEWSANEQSNVPDLFYLVNVKQLTSESGENLLRQQIKIGATHFTLGNLIPGERYEMTIRSATSLDRISSTAAIIEINMPKEDEYFEVGNLIITSHFKNDGTGVVNLTWDVPPEVQHRIVSYDVQYSEEGRNDWKQLKFSGIRASAALYSLKSDTEYVLRIRTVLTNRLETESGLFRFRTPKVAVNPISKVDVIFSSDTNSVRLQWMLEPHVQQDQVVGYDVYLTENKDLPESHWRHIPLNRAEAALSVEDLKSATTYYVKVHVRRADGTVLSAPFVYRFKTIDYENTHVESRAPNSLAYRNIGPGKVNVSWSYPFNIAANVIGSVVYYTDDKHLPLDQWKQLHVTNPKQKTIELSNLREGTQYHVHIVPKMSNGELDFSSSENFQLRTDKIDKRIFDTARHPRPSHRPQPPMQSMELPEADSEPKQMRILGCNPDAFKVRVRASNISNNVVDWLCLVRKVCASRGEARTGMVHPRESARLHSELLNGV